MNDSIWPEKTWNNHEITSDFPNAPTLGDIINRAEATAKLQGVVVCEIRANGLRLTEEQESQFKNTPISEIQTLTIKTQKIEALLDESLGGCCDYLDQIAASLETAAVLFRDNDLNAAHKHYKACTEGVQLFIEMITHYKIVHRRSRGEDAIAGWKNHETKLLAILGQILEAYRKRDYILVADLLEYELINALYVWRQELLQMEPMTKRDLPASEIQT